jgi:hypothetical protein
VLGGHAWEGADGVTASSALHEQVQRVRDRLSFVLIYAPSFPAEDETSVAQETERLLSDLRGLWDRVQDVERKHWLDLAAHEVLEARGHFERGDQSAGCSLIQSAEERLAHWQRGTKISASFIGDPAGLLRKG